MKIFTASAVGLLLGVSAFSLSAEDVVDYVATNCATEIEAYCSQVMPGEGRMMACFYAHEDKISGQCVNALWDAAEALEDAIDTFVDIAVDCEADIDKFCADIEMGEGRILRCLESSVDSLSEDCAEELAEAEE